MIAGYGKYLSWLFFAFFERTASAVELPMETAA
jgi:hypothetical protein